MKRLGILVLALAGLAALFGSCGGGGGEETGILAVAFRLDGESPLLTAYFGDPTEDPLQLPSGRYYIEALDEGDVLISLGAVDIEEGDVVEFPASFDAAGGVADPQQAEPLITMASFLIDVELAELTFWEIVTGGFTETPFDPSVELDEADFRGLAAMYEDIAAQEDSVLGALDKIEGRAEVSLRIPYVRFPWAPAEDLKEVREEVLISLVAMARLGAERKAAGDPEVDEVDFGEVILKVALNFRAHLHAEGKTLQKSEGLLDKVRKWEEYAKTVGADLPALQNKISDDLKQLFPGATSKQIDDWTKDYVNEIAKAVPEPAAPLPPEEPVETEPEEPAAPAPEEPSEPEAEEPAEPSEPEPEEPVETEPEEPAAPAPEEPSEPEPEEPAAPEPEEPAAPEPEGRDVTATGFYVNVDAFLAPGEAVVGNTITLRFNTGGGTVTGDGRLDWTTPASAQCPGGTRYFTCKYDGGTYDPESKKLSGACSSKAGHQRYSAVSVDDNGGWHWECEPVSGGPFGGSIEWEATWEDGTIEGSHGPTSYQLKLTVQG